MDFNLIFSSFLLSIVFSLLYKYFTFIGLNFAKLLMTVFYGALAVIVSIGFSIPQDSLFIIILLPFTYNFLDFLVFSKLDKVTKNIKEENKTFNKPQYSPSGCLMGSTEGKNTNETIMKILQEGKKEAKKMNKKLKNKS